MLSTRLAQLHVDTASATELAALRPRLATERLSERGRAGSGMLNALAGFGIAFLLYMSIVLYGQTVLRGVIEEKNTRVSEVVVASVPTNTLLAGKVLGVGAVGITQQVVWFTTGYLLARVRVPILHALGAEGRRRSPSRASASARRSCSSSSSCSATSSTRRSSRPSARW